MTKTIERLEELIYDSGLTQAQIAVRAGMPRAHRGYVSVILCGHKDPKTATLERLANAAGYRIEFVKIETSEPAVGSAKQRLCATSEKGKASDET